MFSTSTDFTRPKPSKKFGLTYSVVAKTNVTAFYISREDLMYKLSKDLQQHLNKQANKKIEWITKRQNEISQNVRQVYNMEQGYQNYVNKSKEVGKQYPQANKSTQKMISIKQVNKPMFSTQDSS